MGDMEACEILTADENNSCYLTDSDSVTCDEYGLAFEPYDDFSDDPLEFEELAEAIWEVLTDTYIAAASYNKLSPHYITLCSHLEKNIRQMGSLCVTKAVLEQKDMQFPKMEGMTVQELYTMVSLHFRKCRAAYQELRDSGSGFDMERLDWVCRWGLLAEKLKATEARIQKIRSGKISADDLIGQSRVFYHTAGEKRGNRNRRGIGKAASLPLLRSFAGELVRKKKREQAAKARAEREALKDVPGGFRSPRCFSPDKKQPACDEENRRGYPAELSKTGETGTESAAAPARNEALFPGPGGGPSDAVRRKLREQRKKKKKR